MAEKLKLIAVGNQLSAEADGAKFLVRVMHKTTSNGSRLYIEIENVLADALKDPDSLPIADKVELRDTICEAIRRAFNDAMRLQ